MWGAGTVLAGRYELRQRIGSGSMGDVWRALDTVLGREVAVKILLPALLDDAGFAARFHTEARVLAALSHPGIVSVFDYGEADDPPTAFLVMELITGRPLSELLAESAPLSEATTLTVVAQTLEALQAAHDRGIVHRDVKPANLMLRGGGVVVTDFGVARTADARRLTAADVVLGTAVYAAPEQARHTAVTAAADQYAVGVIAYECLTGAPPFDGGTPLGIMMKHLQEPVPPLPDTVSAPVRELVMRALAKDPAARFASAREMAEAARRLAARGEGAARIGTAEDSFQTGVDVAAVAAAAAGPQVDADFLSFTVVPRGDETEDADSDGTEDRGDGQRSAAGDADGGAGSVSGAVAEAAAEQAAEAAPAWASFTVQPQAQGADWASFTVRGAGDETAPLPDGESAEAAAEGEAGGSEESAAAPAEAGRRRNRTVPQDSFTEGLEDIEAEAVAKEPVLRIAPGHSMPLNSFNAGVELDPVEESDGTSSVPMERPRPAPDSDPGSDPDSGPDSEPPSAGRRRAIMLAAAGAAVLVAMAVAYPLSHGTSSASAASRSPQVVAASTSAASGTSISAVSVTSVVSETSTIVVSSSAPSPTGKSSTVYAVPPSSTSGKPVATSTPGPALTSRPTVSSDASSPVVPPPPVTSSSTAVPHKSGYITNVGDGDAIDVFGNSSGAPLYTDGSSLTVEPKAGRTGQSFVATALTANGQAVYEFGDGLDTNQLIDAGGGKISLTHCACGSANQMWWLSQDSSTPSGAFYLNSQGTGQCLTDNGASYALSLKPCVAGNKAQQWYLP